MVNVRVTIKAKFCFGDWFVVIVRLRCPVLVRIRIGLDCWFLTTIGVMVRV